MGRGAALSARVASCVLVVALVVVPSGSWAQTAIDPSTYSHLIDSLRDAEKAAQSGAVRDAIRTARRALDRAQEHAENSRSADARKEVDAAGAALAGVASQLASEPEAVRNAVGQLQKELGLGAADEVTVSKASVETAGGLHVATFDTLQGTVTVNLPDDLAAGDTISGTVLTEPKGDSPQKKAENQDSLSGVVVEVAQQQAPASSSRGKWIIPAAAAAAIPLVLRDRHGREIGKVSVPVAKATAQKPAEGFQTPAVGQSGKPVAITGSFDGDFATSAVRVAGHALNVLAESPRKLVAQAPTDVSGVSQIEVEEKGTIQRCEYRNVVVKLSAPILDLKSGQTTTMTLTVEGLAGLAQSFPVAVINRSPSVVRVAQGDRQTIEIEPLKAAGGSFVATRTLTGVVPGGFNITASIPPGVIPSVRCSVVSTGGSTETPTATGSSSKERPTTSVGALNPPDVLKPPAPPEPPDDPERLRNANVVVHTGLEWRDLADGRLIVTFRDNPPMSGVVDLTPGWAYSPAPGAVPETRATWWQRFSRFQVWENADHRFAGSAMRTFTDANNPSGDLGVAAAGNLPAESSAARRVRFHSNGLLLQPGVPVAITLQRRALGPAWASVGNANGTVELDGATMLVPVALVLVQETSVTPPMIDLELAQLWFDGRTVNRLQITSSPTRSAVVLLDRDPHPAWTVDRLMDPGSSRLLTGALAQDPDQVWSQCGRYGRNIQFRLVRFGTVPSTAAGTQCANVSGAGAAAPSTLEYCIGGWGEALKRTTGNTTNALTIAIAADYTIARGVAQAWREGILIGWRAVGSQTTDQSRTVAHEMGHVLGWGSPLFNDGFGGAGNLMAGGGPTLTRDQCDVAYTGARAIISGR
jgi:hypothetical protein